MACVVSRPIRSASASGPSGWAQPSRMPRSMSAAEAAPDSAIRTASSRYGTSRALTMNPARSAAWTTSLPSTSAAKAVRPAGGVLAGQQGGHQLDERQHRNGVEEVQADDLLGACGGGGEPDDRAGTRCWSPGSRPGAVPSRPAVRTRPASRPRPPRRPRRPGRGRPARSRSVVDGDPGERGVPVRGGELSGGRGAVQGAGDAPCSPASAARPAGLDDDHVPARTGAHLGDAGAHQAAAHDPDPFDSAVGHRSSLVGVPGGRGVSAAAP